MELLAQRSGLLLARRVPRGQLHRPAAAVRPRRVPAARRDQLAAAVAPDGAFAPFTGAEWPTISGFSQPYDVCLDWPKPRKRPPRLPAVKLPASVPILIVGGDLDSLTPLLDAPVFGPKLGENVEIVPLRNTVHVTSAGRRLPRRGDALRADGDPLVPARDARTARARRRSRRCTRPTTYAPRAGDARLRPRPGRGRAPRRRRSACRRSPTPCSAATTRASTAARACAAARSPRSGDAYTLRDVRFTPTSPSAAPGRWDASTGGARVDLTVGGVQLTAEWTQRTPQATVRIGDAVLSTPAP